MPERFRILRHDGRELSPDSVEAFARLLKAGEITEPDLICDALTGEWAPARAHPVYRMIAEGILTEHELHSESEPPELSEPPTSQPSGAEGRPSGDALGLSLAAPVSEPTPKEAASAFIAQMEEERRSDPDRPPELENVRSADGMVYDVVAAPAGCPISSDRVAA